jgi:hypothetical protein
MHMHTHTHTHTCHMGGCRIATHTRVPWPPLCPAAKKMQEATRTLGTESERECVSEVTFPSAELASVTIDSKYDVNHTTVHWNLSPPLSKLDSLCVVCECYVCRGSPVLGPLGPCLVFTLLPPFTRTVTLTRTGPHSKYCDHVPACTASVLCVCALFDQG